MKSIAWKFAAIATLIVTPAAAADMSVKAPAPAPALASNWAGFYAGGAIGARIADPVSDTTSIFPTQGFAPGPDAHRSYENTAFYVKGYAGHNWQVAPMWIVGLEGSVGWANNKSTKTGIPGDPPGIITNLDTTYVNADWDASIRGRVGALVAPSWLLYGAAGVAWQHIGYGASCVGA